MGSLLVHKLFALVKQSVTVNGGLSKLTPRPSPNITPRSSVLIASQLQTHQQQQQKHKKVMTKPNMHRLRSKSSSTQNGTPSSTNNAFAMRSYSFDQNERKLVWHKPKKPKTKSVDYTDHSRENSKSSTNISNLSNGHGCSRSLTPELLQNSPLPEFDETEHGNDDDGMEFDMTRLTSIMSNEELIDIDPTKIKKMSIGSIRQRDELIAIASQQSDIEEELSPMTVRERDAGQSTDDDMFQEEADMLQSNLTRENTLKIPNVGSPPSHRRSSSLLEMMNLHKVSQIISSISTEHIQQFHNCTHQDNEILLLCTKLLIILFVCVISSFCSFLLLLGIIRTTKVFANAIFFVYGMDSFVNIFLLLFTFKFSNPCYNILFNCGRSNRSTKLCFPMVKTAALTWKFCCCAKKRLRVGDNNALSIQLGKNEKSNHLRTNTFEFGENGKCKNIQIEDDKEENEAKCHINCCFCCWGNEQEIQIYHMARGEVELMIQQNNHLYT